MSPTPLQFYAVTGEAMPQMGPPWETNEPNNGAGTGNNEPVVWFNDDYDLIDGPTTMVLMYVCECESSSGDDALRAVSSQRIRDEHGLRLAF